MNHIRIPDWQSRGRGFESHLLQGSPNPSGSKDLANNLFSNNDVDIYNDANAYTFTYNYGTGNLRIEPSGTSNYNKNDHTFSVNYSQDCPDQLSSTGNPADNPFDLWAYAKNANDTLIDRKS